MSFYAVTGKKLQGIGIPGMMIAILVLASCQKDDNGHSVAGHTDEPEQAEVPEDTNDSQREQAGETAGSFVLYEKDELISINRMNGDEIEKLYEVEVPTDAVFHYDGCCNLAVIERLGDSLHVFDGQGQLKMSEKLLWGSHVISVHTDGDNVYVGGYQRDAKFQQYNLNTDTWFLPYTPDWFASYAKAIDDFVINGNQLIAIDNVSTPKYLLYYDLDGDQKAEYTGDFLMHHIAPEAVIHQGEISDEFIGVMGSYYPGAFHQDYVMVYRLDNKDSVFVFTSTPLQSISDHDHHFVDFLIDENHIIYASTQDGVGRLEIRDELFFPNEQLHISMYNDFINYIEDYIELPGVIHNLTAIPGGEYYVATYRESEGGYKHKVLEY